MVHSDFVERLGVDALQERGMTAQDTLMHLFSTHQKTTLTVALLRYVDGMTLEETAKKINRSVSYVRYHLRKLKRV